MAKDVALVTGASSGLGVHFAEAEGTVVIDRGERQDAPHLGHRPPCGRGSWGARRGGGARRARAGQVRIFR